MIVLRLLLLLLYVSVAGVPRDVSHRRLGRKTRQSHHRPVANHHCRTNDGDRGLPNHSEDRNQTHNPPTLDGVRRRYHHRHSDPPPQNLT